MGDIAIRNEGKKAACQVWVRYPHAERAFRPYAELHFSFLETEPRLGGADAISCNAVVKGFGAEVREDYRLAKVISKWRHRTRRTWVRGTISVGFQAIMLLAMRVL
ncbi:hypothetical protein [Mesorhizobium neociceri]|uniref:hypothetical protein n=1 Tax=Mesorhizobium neociceri TaxID=1307853 RepID=UPI001F2B85FB|nr:hypothetical protein [Mesorhizobium neociceri]